MSAQIKDTFRSFHLSPFFLVTLETYPVQVQLYLFNLFNELLMFPVHLNAPLEYFCPLHPFLPLSIVYEAQQ